MNTAKIDTLPPRSFGEILNGILSVPARFLASVRAAKAMEEEFEILAHKSDQQLAEIGVKREDIARHVFRKVLEAQNL